LWFRRTRLVILAPDPRHPRRAQADNPLNDLSEFSRPPLMVQRAVTWGHGRVGIERAFAEGKPD